MHSSKWHILGNAVFDHGRWQLNGENAWKTIESIPGFYKQILTTSGVKINKPEKFFRIGEQCAVVVAIALLVLKNSDLSDIEDFDQTAVLGYGDEGSHNGNLIYWNDYADNGHLAAQGHLFVGTLASTPLTQLALVLGSHAPVYYVSAASEKSSLASEIDFLEDQCQTLFLIESKVDYCRCLFLKSDPAGISSEKIISFLQEEK